MRVIKKKVYNSFIYNFIVYICEIIQNSYFFKPQVFEKYQEKSNKYSYAFGYRLWLSIDYYLEKLWIKIRDLWNNSKLIISLQRYFDKAIKNSYVGKFISKFNFVYIIALYVYIDYFLRTYITAISSIWDELLFIIIIGWILFKRVIYNQRYRFTSLDLPIMFFVLVQLFLLFINSPDMKVAIEGYRAVVQYVLWFFLVVQLVDNDKIVKNLIWIFIVAVGLLGIHGIYQYLTGAEMLGNWIDSGESISTRAYSIVKSPNILASLLILYIPVSFGVFLAERDIFKKLLALFLTLCMGIGLIFTFSRGAWIAIFVSVLIMFLFLSKRMIIPIITLTFGALVYINALWSRIYYLLTPEYKAKSSVGGRLYRWNVGIEEWSKNKLFGLGLGRFGGAVATNNNLTPFYMDNYYLKTLTETGIVGLSSLIILLGITLRQLYLSIKSTKSYRYRFIMFGILAGICAVSIHNFTENIFESPLMVTYFWTNVAILFSMYRIDRLREGIKRP